MERVGFECFRGKAIPFLFITICAHLRHLRISSLFAKAWIRRWRRYAQMEHKALVPAVGLFSSPYRAGLRRPGSRNEMRPSRAVPPISGGVSP